MSLLHPQRLKLLPLPPPSLSPPLQCSVGNCILASGLGWAAGRTLTGEEWRVKAVVAENEYWEDEVLDINLSLPSEVIPSLLPHCPITAMMDSPLFWARSLLC